MNVCVTSYVAEQIVVIFTAILGLQCNSWYEMDYEHYQYFHICDAPYCPIFFTENISTALYVMKTDPRVSAQLHFRSVFFTENISILCVLQNGRSLL